MTSHLVSSGEVREIGRLIIAFSEALGIEPNSVSSAELCERVRALSGEAEHLRAKLGAVAQHRDELGREAGWNAAVAGDLQVKCNRLSVLLRGMTHRAIHHRRYGVAMSQHALDLSREIDRLTKPNPWFTPPAEFPIEAAERADRERASIAYAFPTQEWREQQLDDAATVRTDRAEEGP